MRRESRSWRALAFVGPDRAPPDRERDEAPEAPETPPDEPAPVPVKDPPPQPDTKGPYVVQTH
jgi:hypothetical protein